MYNADESGFPLCSKSCKIVAGKGAKHVYNVSSSDKGQITVLACCSASGHYIPNRYCFPARGSDI